MMISARTLAFPALERHSQPRTRLMQILFVALLALAVLTPSASAKCLSKDFKPAPKMPSAIHSAAQSNNGITPAGPSTIVGLWNITFLADGQAFDYGFDLFHADGTELLNDVTNPIEGNVCVGVWQQTAPRTYSLKHVTWNFDSYGNLIGSGVFYENLKLSSDGNSYGGSITSVFYDLSGNVVGEFSGTVQATRIKPV